MHHTDPSKIDVVLLTKNSLQPSLNNCVESIYENIPVSRLIVVDGGSTDGTLELLRKYPGVQIVDDSGGTRATARQLGIENVETEWHVHVDSDVVLSNNWFKKAWKLVDSSVGAIWGVAVPTEKHFLNIDVAMSKLYKTSVKELLVKQMRSERCMMHDTLIRTASVKDIKIPKNLHIWEDEFIGRHIMEKGYRFLKVTEPYCLHNLTPNERFYGFVTTGYLSKKYGLSKFRNVFRRLLLALTQISMDLYSNKGLPSVKNSLLKSSISFQRVARGLNSHYSSREIAAITAKVDLVMWAKNGAKTLTAVLERVDEVISAEFVNSKIMVDDGSTDTTGQIGKSFGWNVIPNRGHGISDGANTALRNVTAKFFVSLEQDLLLARDWLLKIPPHLENPKVAVASGMRFATKPVGVQRLQQYVAKKYRGEAELESWLRGREMAAFMLGKTLDNTIYKTEVMRAIGGFPKLSSSSGVDTTLAYRVANMVTSGSWTMPFSRII